VNFDVLIAGAGLAGSTAARLLAEQYKKVLIVERLNHIAGHCYDFKNKHGINVHKYGPHILHTCNAEVWKFLKRFTKIRPYEHRVLSSVNGMLLPFPINRDTIAKLYQIKLSSDQVRDFLEDEVSKSSFKNPPQNFRDQVVSQVGERLYEIFYRNYTIKQWQKKPEQLSAEIAARIPVRDNTDDRYFTDTYQGIPLSGYTALVENMLNHPKITVELAADFFKMADIVQRDITIFTGLLDQYFGFKYGKLEYRSLKLVFETFPQEHYQPAAVVNYPNDHEWTRITEFKHFTGESLPHTTVCFEYPKAHGKPYYVVVNKANMKKRSKYMAEVAKLEKKEKCYFIGRLAEYRYYNMDQVVATAMEKVKQILAG
jgi:UDP-galactopyranose mutase